jgi:hypothetical protein
MSVPPDRYSGHYRGWIETYWTPMKEIIATGTISLKVSAGMSALPLLSEDKPTLPGPRS